MKLLERATLSFLLTVASGGAIAGSFDRIVSVHINAQPLSTALIEFSKQADVQVITPAAKVKNLDTRGVRGEMTLASALKKLLEGTRLGFHSAGANTIGLDEGSALEPAAALSGENSVRLSQGDVSQPSSSGSDAQLAHPEQDSGESSGPQLEEVIVTATKRANEKLQDVPMSIAVISNQEIERRGLIGMEDYLRSVPGVNEIDNGASGNAIVIRGITTAPEGENGTGSGGPTVATYFDETPITGAAGLAAGGVDLRLVDIERIEVLRGPQGTAYGSSSLGGTLRIIPAEPKLDRFRARMVASYSDTGRFGSDNSMVQATVNLPVVEGKFGVRAVGYRYDESGFYRNIAGIDAAMIDLFESVGLGNSLVDHVRDDVGRMRSTGGRLAALWRPIDALDASFIYVKQKIEQDGNPVAGLHRYVQSRGPIAPQDRVRGQSGEIADTDMDLASLVARYDLGWAALTSAASWVDTESQRTIGGQSFFGPIYGIASSTAPSTFNSFSAETRLASKFKGRMQFLAGLFYENVDSDLSVRLDWPGTADTNPVDTNPMFVYKPTRRLEQRAVFGELSYDLSRKVTATVGGRYFDYDKREGSLFEGGLAGGTPLGQGVPVVLRSDENDSTFKANVSYKPTTDALLYATWSQGFRLGRPDVGLSPYASQCDADHDGTVDGTDVSIESTETIKSDSLQNIELGAKLSALDRRLLVNTSVYHISWDELPVRATIGNSTATTCNGFAYFDNAGAATSDGMELQASIFVARRLRLDIGASYVKAELSENSPGLGAKGDRLPGAPKFSANFAMQYDFDVAGYQAFVRADSLYAGKFYGDLQSSSGTQAGNYIKVDARSGVAIKNFTVELFARNLTNQDAFTWRGLFAQGAFFGYRLRPRTIGLQLAYQFE